MEQNDLLNAMQQMSKRDLFAILNNPGKHSNELRAAAAEELEKRQEAEDRGEVYPPVKEEKHQSKGNFFSNRPDQISHDPNEMPLYSFQAIWGFSIFFSPIFGSILMASNLRTAGFKKQAFGVVIFGVVYLLAALAFTVSMGTPPSLTILINIIGALIIKEFFWNRFLGRGIHYRKKSITKPLIISILVALAVALLLINNMPAQI